MTGIITVEQVVSADGFAAGPDDDLSFHSFGPDPARSGGSVTLEYRLVPAT